jgi:Xaa-Pro aminopeptidase
LEIGYDELSVIHTAQTRRMAVADCDYRVFETEEIRRRMEELQAVLRERGIDGALLLQRSDMIYYTGAVFQGAVALPARGYASLFAWRGCERLGDWIPATIGEIKGPGRLTEALGSKGIQEWKTVGFEEDVVPVALWRSLTSKVWPHGTYRDIAADIRRQRSVKSEAELQMVRRSGQILAGGFEALRTLIAPGEPSNVIQAEMAVVLRRLGDQHTHRARGFNAEAGGIVGSGADPSVPITFEGPLGQPGVTPLAPNGAGAAPILDHGPIIVDQTAGFHGYQTDMTRTFRTGPVAERFQEAHAFCVGLHEGLLRRMKPGEIPSEIYLWALDQAARSGYADTFMNRGRSRVRFLGHGVGIELDELPVLAKPFTEPLKEGMVVAVEPKVVFDDGAVGVEDTVIVRAGGAEVVTPMEYGLIEAGSGRKLP